MNLTVEAQETTIATDDLKDVVEKIKSVAFSDIMLVFPDGAGVNPGDIGGFLLDNESIIVNYPSLSADPLLIEVIIRWDSKRGGQRTITYSTLRTRML